MSKLKAGLALVDVSPEKGVELAGYPYFRRHNTGINDPIYAAVMAFEKDGKRLVLLTSDQIGIRKDHIAATRAALAKKYGLKASELLLCCAHPHSAPVITEWALAKNDAHDAWAADVSYEYVDFIGKKLTEACEIALDNMFEAEVAVGMTHVGREQGIGGNRRDPEHGPCDPDLPLIAVRDMSGVIRGLFTKYALHPTIMHGESTLVSADYPGYIRAYLKERRPEMVFCFAQGTSGNQSPRYYAKPNQFSECKRFGDIMGAVIDKAIGELKFSADVDFASASKEIELPMRPFPTQEAGLARINELKAQKQKYIDEGAPYVKVQTADLWLLGAECDYSYAIDRDEGRLDKQFYEDAPFEVMSFRVGDSYFACVPGEMFVEFGLRIKELSPHAMTSVITLSNGSTPGYICTAEAFGIGGYETGNSMLDPKTGDILGDGCLELMKQL